MESRTVDVERSGVEIIDAQRGMIPGEQDDWVTRARSAYAAAQNSAADAITHYREAALVIIAAREQAAKEKRRLTQQDIAAKLGIQQPAVSKLLAWERKYRHELASDDKALPIPSPYSPPSPENLAERKQKKAESRNRATETQRQFQEVLRDNENKMRSLATEIEAKDVRIAELERGVSDLPSIARSSTDSAEIENAIKYLLSRIAAPERLEMLARIDSWVRAG